MLLSLPLLLMNIFPAIFGKHLHDYMTEEEIESIFQIQSDQVHALAYEVVPIVMRCGRPMESNRSGILNTTDPELEILSVYFETFGNIFNLHLKENSGILFGNETPVITPFIGSDSKINYTERSYDIIPQLKIVAYHDQENSAALTMYEDDDGKTNLNGIVKMLIVHEIPKRLQDEVLSKHPDLSKPMSIFNQTCTTRYHIVINRDVVIESDLSWIEKQWIRFEDWILRLRLNWCYKKPTVPLTDYQQFTAYPKILPVLDYTTYFIHNESVIECVKYMITYWNVVDLRFRQMDWPKVRLNIAGIIVLTKPNIIPQFDKKIEPDSFQDIYEGLLDLDLYFAEENGTKIDYDIVAEFTPRSMGIPIPWWRSFLGWLTGSDHDSFAGGIARLGSICFFPRQAMAILIDHGDLTRINAGVHEIGHILGAEHDPHGLDEDDPNYKSDFKHGFIMSYEKVNENQLHWSDFSIRAMQQFLQIDQVANCMLKKPKVGTSYRKKFCYQILKLMCPNIIMWQADITAKNKKFWQYCVDGEYVYNSKNLSYMKVISLITA